jgi:hypothetical protein
MSTQAQIDANRLNAEKSTGPVTESGLAASSQNRATHGLASNTTFRVLPDEFHHEYSSLVDNLIRQHHPATDEERALLLKMARHEWMRLRAQRYMDKMFHCDPNLVNPLCRDTEKQFALMMRYHTMHERAFNNARNMLLKARAETKKEQIGFERKKVQTEHLEMQKQRHQTAQKAKQIDADCKIIRALCKAANNEEALALARGLKASHQAA